MKSAIAILLLLLILLIVEYPTIFIPLVVLVGGILFIVIKRTYDKILKEERAISEAIEMSSDIYNEIKSEIDFPVETRIVHYKGGDEEILEGSLQVWLKDGMLCFFPFIPVIDEPVDIKDKVYLFKINIRDIDCFFKEESRPQETILKYSNKGKDYSMKFSSRDYRIFKEIIPDKIFLPSKSGEKIGELASYDR